MFDCRINQPHFFTHQPHLISMQTPVDNPLMTIESFNRQFQIGEKEREAIEWGWNQEMGNASQWSMFYACLAQVRDSRLGKKWR